MPTALVTHQRHARVTINCEDLKALTEIFLGQHDIMKESRICYSYGRNYFSDIDYWPVLRPKVVEPEHFTLSIIGNHSNFWYDVPTSRFE
jgi:hypothetical protein